MLRSASTVRARSRKRACRSRRSRPSCGVPPRAPELGRATAAGNVAARLSILFPGIEFGRKTPMATPKLSNRPRIVVAALLLILGAYWVGARWGPRQPETVGAVPSGLVGGKGDPRDSGLTDEETINVRVYRQPSPAVANVLTKATEYDFFMEPVAVEGAGSGFVIDPRGYILTNFHVVEGAQSIEVVLGDRSRYAAKFVGADRRNDVALIKVDAKGKQLASVPLGDSGTLQVGQKVLAIGNPFGWESTLPIGGWLADALDLPVKEGLLVETVTRGGPAEHAGLHGGDRTALAGMRRIAIGGDVIVAVDGQRVANNLDLNVLLNKKRPDYKVTVTIYRGGQKMDVPVTLGDRPGS